MSNFTRGAIKLENIRAAKDAGLTYVHDDSPGITRRKSGNGFVYLYTHGKTITRRTTLDRILLTCFKYDPAQRKYGVYAWGVMRFGAGAVGLALIALLGTLWWAELKTLRKGKVA